jgi:hypothetical protein
MALPTNGRVVINTTAGEIDIELWSKVCNAFVEYMDWLLSIHPLAGNTENMPELHRTRAGRSGIVFISETKLVSSFGGQVIMMALFSIG